MTTAPDILAPYLVQFTGKPNAIESAKIYDECINGIQTEFTEHLNFLRRQYDDVRVYIGPSFELSVIN